MWKLHAGQEATVRPGHGTTNWFKIGKGVRQGCVLSLCLFILCEKYITHHGKCWVGWITSWNQDCQEKYQQLQICRWYHSNGRKRRVTKEPLDEGEGGQWQIDLKLNIQKTKIMASGPITLWQIDGKTMETWQILFSWAPNSLQMVTAAMKLKDTYSLEGKLWPT